MLRAHLQLVVRVVDLGAYYLRKAFLGVGVGSHLGCILLLLVWRIVLHPLATWEPIGHVLLPIGRRPCRWAHCLQRHGLVGED